MANAPRLVRFDLSMVKRVKIHGSVNFEFRAEMLNAFNSPYFNIASTGGQPLGVTTSFYGAGRTVRQLQQRVVPGGQRGGRRERGQLPPDGLLGDNTSRIIQLVWRVRW